jgi:methionyl-tRNA synthetase
MEKYTVITATPPTPNGPLHVGHLSGPYIAGDIAARAARARGERVLTMTGLDNHQNYVPAKARALGRPVDETLRDYCAQIRQAYALARVEYDVLLDPAEDADYRKAMDRLLTEFVRGGALVTEETTLHVCADCGRTLHQAYVAGTCPVCGAGAAGGTCEGCGGFTTAGTLVGARSTCCAAPRAEISKALPLLRLEAYRDRLIEAWARAQLPPRVVAMLRRYLDAGLPDIVAAYPTDWGIELGDLPDPGLRLDVWVEMGLGHLYATARAVDPTVSSASSVADCVRAWRQVAELWQFLGIDNAFYNAIMFPALFAAAGLPAGTLSGLVVNEFYRLEGGKFSTSRGHAIWANDFLAGEDPGVVRLFLCQDRPDRYESDFTLAAYHAFRDGIGVAAGDGTGRAGPLAADVDRAAHALRPAAFDPALAVRCLLPAAGGPGRHTDSRTDSKTDSRTDSRAAALLGALTGQDRP